MVRGVFDSGYDRLGLGAADGVPGAVGSVPVPATRPEADWRVAFPGGAPPPSAAAHRPTPVPSATVPANAAAITARFRITCRAGPRRLCLCWVTLPTYDRSPVRRSAGRSETLPFE
ncbi:hypothetical protein Srubr_56160 [Streptomyces rubradiris]|uniref:Uncharacterized protein n=1 Tax=Streptomyces rubradiris TaxID=285531 RepID=A0ABQ3RIY5_STRRR|nr:hypothetical protein GCM10018792_28010 [Streptomyces rubradiris]GHI55770.1 hypothetical protein Srubr_56160 [Streptomyces rubradiris]